MSRCPNCEYPIPDDRERTGSRCPNCHDPLYEPALRFSRLAREGEASCVVHAGMESVGVCARCNQHLCETCRTRWRGVIICATCADRALSTHEAVPHQTGAPIRQARAGLMFAAGAWLTAAVASAGLYYLASGSDLGTMAAFFCLALLGAAALLASVGLGQCVAALRMPGPSRPLATLGLALGGLYLGVLVGLGTLSLWQY